MKANSRLFNRSKTAAAASVVSQGEDPGEASVDRNRYSGSVRTFEEVDLKVNAQTFGAYLAAHV
jgi:hypothetical protein